MTIPVRLQLSRKRGFNLQELSLATNGRPAVNVARPHLYGNSYVIGRDGTRDECVARHRAELEYLDDQEHYFIGQLIADLRGKNLACWCSLGLPCHADVLLEIANRPICEPAP